MDTEERFWAKVRKNGSCWLWTGARNSNGRGSFKIDGKAVAAHRFAWELHYGPVPPGKHVLHTCHKGHEGCVNPHHLKLGTHKENMNDVDCIGERRWNANVPDNAVIDTVSKYKASRVTYQHLANELELQGYKVSAVTIGNWVRGETRKSC